MVDRPGAYTRGEWRRALEVSDRLIKTTRELELDGHTEWLRQVMHEAASQLRATVLWAASQGVADKRGQTLRAHVVAADAARSDASLASYFLNFLTSEGLIDPVTAFEVESLLQQTEVDMAEMSRGLTQELGFDPYAAYPE